MYTSVALFCYNYHGTCLADSNLLNNHYINIITIHSTISCSFVITYLFSLLTLICQRMTSFMFLHFFNYLTIIADLKTYLHKHHYYLNKIYYYEQY